MCFQCKPSPLYVISSGQQNGTAGPPWYHPTFTQMSWIRAEPRMQNNEEGNDDRGSKRGHNEHRPQMYVWGFCLPDDDVCETKTTNHAADHITGSPVMSHLSKLIVFRLKIRYDTRKILLIESKPTINVYSAISSPFCSGIAVLQHASLPNPSLSVAPQVLGALFDCHFLHHGEPNIELRGPHEIILVSLSLRAKYLKLSSGCCLKSSHHSSTLRPT